MRFKTNIQRTILLLVLLLAGWAWNCPLSAVQVRRLQGEPLAFASSGNDNTRHPSRVDENVTSYQVRLNIPNKSALNYVYYSAGNHYGYIYGSDTIDIAVGENVYLQYSLNTGYKLKTIYLNGQEVELTGSSNSYDFTMPEMDVDLRAETEFDPSPPTDPQPADTTKQFQLELVSNPLGSGTFSGAGKHAPGKRVGVNAYANSGYVFTCWTQNGDTLSTKSSFTYTMPASDAVLTAHYIYNPSSPTDPEQPKLKHPLTVISSPVGAGSFSYTDSQITFGEEYYVYAYPNTGYKFKGWIVNGVLQEETTTSLRRTMTETGAAVVGLFVYDPESPANPGANYYNPTTGQAIIDDYTPGNLYTALRNVVGSENYENVNTLIVKGQLNASDYGYFSYFTNAATIDLSRTGGLEEVPGYAFQNSKAASILLPADMTQIGNYAFSGCENLTSLTLYAQVPPACSTRTFQNFTGKDNCTVFVPASAIELYTADESWKDFTILPITMDAHLLQVNLPEDAADGRYKHYSIELVNMNSGVRQRYVISDRMLYTFNGLRKDEQYNVYMYSQAGLEIGRIENVVIPDGDLEVTFDNLKKLYTVFAKVLLPDGNEVTSQVTVEWLKTLEDGSVAYLRKANSLTEIPEGQPLLCRITLGNTLGMTYLNPEDVVFTVAENQETCVVTLSPFRSVVLSGMVVDADGSAISDASVAVNQLLNGKYTKTFTTKTDRKGLWSVGVLDVPESYVTYSATDCINVNDTIGAFAEQTTALDLGKTTLKSIVGARVTYGFTYHEAGSENIESYYSDYKNVSISVFNVTQNRDHHEVSVQYPILAVLDENINSGDSLRLTAVSKTGAFNPIERIAVVGDNQRADAVFDIVGKGGISASFDMTENPAVIAMLYSSKGELLKNVTYTEAKALFTGLEDGEYTLVSMGQSQLMNSILRLSNFAEIGLQENKDYVKNVVKVESGILSEIKNAEIPAFDESLFYYTNSSTNFSANKSSITTGNYLTLRSAIDFKGVYKNGISNVALVVDLPDACDFVEQSVIQGPNLLPYVLDDKRLTIQLGNDYTSQVRFCAIPTVGGSFNATASIVFDYNGKTITQPIGTAVSEIKDIEITVPSVIAGTTFKVTGTALAKSEVRIYENGTLLGTGKANGAGSWNVECELTNPYNLSTHAIYAEITTPAGNTLTSETKNLTYDVNALQVSKVTMYHWNPEMRKTYISEFDFMNPKTTATQWTVYYPKKVFTYTIEFTDNDPERISNVVLYVHTANGKFVPCNAEFDEQKGLWYAEIDMGSSSDGYYPVNCSVDFDYESEKLIDNNQLLSEYNSLSTLQEQITSQNIAIDDLYGRIKEELNKENIDFEVIDELKAKLEALLGISLSSSSEEVEYDENELYNSLEKFRQEYGIGSINNLLESNLRSIDYNLPEDFGTGNISVSTCDGYDLSVVSEDSTFVKFSVSGDKFIYTKATDFEYIILDFEENVCFKISFNSDSEPNAVSGLFARTSGVGQIQQHSNTIAEKIKAANELLVKLLGAIDEVVLHIDGGIKFAQEGLLSSWLQLEKLKKLQAAGENIASNRIFLLELTCDGWETEIKTLNGIKSGLTNFRAQALGKLFGACGVIANFVDCKNDLDKFISLYFSVPQPCENDQERADDIRNRIRNAGIAAGFYYVGNISADVCALFSIGPSVVAAPASGGSSLGVALVSIGKIALSYGINAIYRNSCDRFISNAQHEILSLQCDKKECGKPGQPACPQPNPGNEGGGNGGGGNNGGGANQSGSASDNVKIDPSGFVYEAVPVNRIEGVQATIYYKETKEDMYGDLYDEVVLWNAEEYAQKNPLFTDENGMYRWDVPQGLWQVKFEKDGYQTAYSEWLPVPPPQLEVNVGIVQNKQPEITEARAYEEGVEVQFDKFMDLSTLTTENIYVTANGEKLNGEIRFIDSALADEYASDDDSTATRYASRIRFVPEQPLGVTTGELRLTVSRNVLSYAGIPMTETFSQALDVEKEVQYITAMDVKVLYGEEKEVTVYAVPFDAAVGRTLHVVNSSELIASVDTTEVILDEEGKAVVKVRGELPGCAQLTFSIDDVTITGSCAVDVVTEIITAEAPQASRASGTAVYRGTKVELTTTSKDAVIYFTTDGTCPCDENGTRRKYSVPVVINEDTKILAMTAVGSAEDEVSEVVEFNYTLKRSDMDFRMEQGWTWISHNFDDAISVQEFASEEAIQKIVGQSQEALRDSVMGFVGKLEKLYATDAYKVESSSFVPLERLTDVAWNPSTPISLQSGWNWIGYPLAQTMSVDEAFAVTEVETLDVIVGQQGFAQFNGEKWVGTLEVLSPGSGYMYMSQSAKDIVYNTSLVSTAAAKNANGISTNLPLVLDIYKYAHIMPMVATIADEDGVALSLQDYQVAAFCGTECRGVGRVIDGLVMMNVYGNPDDEITLQVTDANGLHGYANAVELKFEETVVGDIFQPYMIHINNKTGLSGVHYSGKVKVSVQDDVLRIKGVDPDDINYVEVYSMNGLKIMHEMNVPASGVRIPGLAAGVYVVVVHADGTYSYHKVSVRD